jgi:hypothetical protein
LDAVTVNLFAPGLIVSLGALTVVTKFPSASAVTVPNTPPLMSTLVDGKKPRPAIVTLAVELVVFR